MGSASSKAGGLEHGWKAAKQIPGMYPIICSDLIKLNDEERGMLAKSAESVKKIVDVVQKTP